MLYLSIVHSGREIEAKEKTRKEKKKESVTTNGKLYIYIVTTVSLKLAIDRRIPRDLELGI